MQVPDWGYTYDKVEAGDTLTPLERFVYDNEPFSMQKCKEFRAQLQALILQVLTERKD